MANNMNRQTPRGSFCGKEQRMVKRLVAGPNVYICDECIALCNEILSEEDLLLEDPSRDLLAPVKLPSPAEMKKILDEYPADIRKVVIVTSDYHVPRSMALAEDMELEASGVGSPCLQEYWLKNHGRETLSWIKYWLKKYLHLNL